MTDILKICNMVQIELKIWLSEDLFKSEYSHFYGSKKNDIVCFTYYNTKRDKANEIRSFNYRDALNLAERRQNDKRYKNYEFWISI